MTGPYNDIIDLPHHVSNRRTCMPISDRAAQFSPFAALTGYDAAVKETARLTDDRGFLDESEKELLNKKLQMILERLSERPEVVITYFKPDDRKTGGAYVTVAGPVLKIDLYKRIVVMADRQEVPIEEIFQIEI